MSGNGHQVAIEYSDDDEQFEAYCLVCEWSARGPSTHSINDKADRHEGLPPERDG